MAGLQSVTLDGASMNYAGFKLSNLSAASLQRTHSIGARLKDARWIDGSVCTGSSPGNC